MKLSVIIATYNRQASLLRLLRQLDAQTLPHSQFEVSVVDDGSVEPVEPTLRAAGLTLSLELQRQPNQGAAAARHAAAQRASGDVLVFIDDDMQVDETFLERHAATHEANPRCIVLGPIAPDPSVSMPLFERWHADILQRMADDATSGRVKLRGNQLFTGNASVPRADYFAVGGFDTSLPHSEDAELGLRLEAAGCGVVFAPGARVLHGSDHTSLERFLHRAFTYGRVDTQIARKHPDVVHANPWRFAGSLNAALKPLLAVAVAAPGAGLAVSRGAMAASKLCDRAGLTSVAFKGTTAAFAVQYFGGMREAHGGVMGSARGLLSHLTRATPALAAAKKQWDALGRDHATMQRHEQTYGHQTPSRGRLLEDVVQKIGLQQVAWLRLTRAAKDAGFGTAAKALTRLGRHLYSSDVHWEAELAPGLMLVHGFGLAISHGARIGPDCVLFQNVTLGHGTDARRNIGAPTLGRNVRIGPGATLLGPITVGDNTKIGPGVVLTESVPANSVVEAAPAEIRLKVRNEARPVGLKQDELRAEAS